MLNTHARGRISRTRIPAVALAAASVILLAGCSSGGGTSDVAQSDDHHVVLVTHDSFALADGTLEAFEKQSGITVDVQTAGDAGALVNKLVLTKDSPLGDVVFGIDNTFAGRAHAGGVLEPYVSPDVTDAEKQFELPAGSGGGELTPIDYGDVCVNVDHEWFAQKGLAEPTSLDDLTKPAYQDLLVVESAATSSPGLAFLLATVGAFGTGDGSSADAGWQGYWQKLVANGVKVDASWDDAYYSDFSGPSSDGDRPLVVSYASSPPYEVKDGATTAPTGALLDTCFRQVEYAGVIAGTAHRADAQKVVDFLHSVTAQNDVAEAMYVYPVNPEATVPASWKQFAPVATKAYSVSATDIDAHRDEWIGDWSEIATP